MNVFRWVQKSWSTKSGFNLMFHLRRLSNLLDAIVWRLVSQHYGGLPLASRPKTEWICCWHAVVIHLACTYPKRASEYPQYVPAPTWNVMDEHLPRRCEHHRQHLDQLKDAQENSSASGRTRCIFSDSGSRLDRYGRWLSCWTLW